MAGTGEKKFKNLIADAYSEKGHNPLDPKDKKAEESFGLVHHIKKRSSL